MMHTAKIVNWKGMDCVELSAGGYTAWIANEIGSNVIRMHDDKNGVEFFRWNAENTPDTIKNSAEVWGLPSLYLPNRFADGVLRASDHTYQLPVHEKAPFHNHIHGFLHKRAHTVVAYQADETAAWAKTAYTYDEKDPFFQYLPVSFRVEYTFRLSAEGLHYTAAFTNLSDRMLPMSQATHTTIASPFVDGAKEEDTRIAVPLEKKWILNDRCLPTLEIADPNAYDLQYKTGTMCPVLQNISNDMYSASEQTLNGKPFRGVVLKDAATGKGIAYEVDEQYKFWIIWNDQGFHHYFCPEPMTAMIDAPNLDLPSEQTGYTEVKPGETYTITQHFMTLV